MNKIHIISRAYIRDKDFILLADNGKNLFLPGGHVQANESIIAALKRELFEEIGVQQIAIEGFVGIIENIWDNKGTPFHETNFIFQTSSPFFSFHQEIFSKENHITFRWIKFEELEKYTFLPKNIYKFLSTYERDQRGKFQTNIENKIL